MIGAIASSQAENHFTVPYTNLETYGFSQIPIDAQTGELKIVTTGDEETFSVPKVMTWAELVEKRAAFLNDAEIKKGLFRMSGA